MKSFEQMKASRIKERLIFNKFSVISSLCFILCTAVLVTLALLLKHYWLFIIEAVLLAIFVVSLVVLCVKVRKKEEKIASDKFRAIVNAIVIKDEYELPVLDSDLTVKVTKSGFVIDGELFGYDNFDTFLGTTNLFRQASIAVFVVSNFSPFSDDKTYPINFGIELNEEGLGCAKQYFFDEEYKAFQFILENPEQSAKEILRYGMLKIQIEEQKKQKALDKLAKELSEY